jgi:hypothetical protein
MTRRWGRAIVAAALASAALVVLAASRTPPPLEPLREVFAPTFSQVPPRAPASVTLRALRLDWSSGGQRLRDDLRSWQAAAVLLSLLVILVIGVDWRHRLAPHNLDLLLMWGIGACLFDSMRFFDVLNRPTYLTLLDWVFTGVVALSVVLLVRMLIRRDAPSVPWRPVLGTRSLVLCLAALLTLDVTLALVRPPDDAGWFVNLGAQRLRERGRLPYGDPLLTGTPGAAYGPLLYVAHLPFQYLVSPEPVNKRSPARPQLGEQSTYYLPPVRATQLCAAAFHLAGVLALYVAARRMGGRARALSVCCLYCGSLAILGIGGATYSVAGITFISHVGPSALTLIAFAALPAPATSGICLVLAAAAGFYPAFMAVPWLGYYWRDRVAATRFLAGCVVASVIVVGFTVGLSRPVEGHSRIGTILADTFEHHTEAGGYGDSPFGFWGQRGGVRGALMQPLARSGLTSPAWILFFALTGVTFLLARGQSSARLAALAGCLALAFALIKPHASGTYMAWYYGLLLLGVFPTGWQDGRAAPPAGASSEGG